LLEPEVFGVKNVETGALMEARTMFEAASLTKTMFAVLVLRLVDLGVLTLDEPIARRAPDVHITDDPRIDELTVRLILSHASGLPNWADKPLKFLFDPGKGFRYSGEGYYFLHKAIESITGKSFVDHFRDEFFLPLHMENSAAIWDASVGDRMSNKFDENGDMIPLRNHVDLAGNAPEPNAAWSLYSCAPDYAAFLLSLYKNKAGLSDGMFQEFTSGQNSADDCIAWGLGVGIPKREPSVVWHWGDNGGYRSFAVIDLNTGDGASIFCNSFGGTDLCLELLAGCTDSTFWDGIGRFLETAEAE
jgi:CubicO group peptidase (beta-lactamase class C family)